MYRLAFSVRRVQICTAEDSDCCKGRPAAALQQSHQIVINAHHIHLHRVRIKRVYSIVGITLKNINTVS